MTNTTATLPFISVDSLVQLDSAFVQVKYAGKTFKVVGVPHGRATKYQIMDSNGSVLRAPREVLVRVGDPRWVGSVPDEATFGPSEEAPPLTLGAVVELRGRVGWFVVLGSSGGKFRVASLGGDGNRYLRGVTPELVSRVLAPGEFSLNVS